MKIIGSRSAGTTESGDALVLVEPSEGGIELELSGPSVSRYGADIRAAMLGTLEALGIDAVRVRLQEKGALDCTIRARLCAACTRAADGGSVPWEAMP